MEILAGDVGCKSTGCRSRLPRRHAPACKRSRGLPPRCLLLLSRFRTKGTQSVPPASSDGEARKQRIAPTLLSVLITSDSTVLALARQTRAVISIVELFVDLGHPQSVLMAPLTVVSPGPRLAGKRSRGKEVLKPCIEYAASRKKREFAQRRFGRIRCFKSFVGCGIENLTRIFLLRPYWHP